MCRAEGPDLPAPALKYVERTSSVLGLSVTSSEAGGFMAVSLGHTVALVTYMVTGSLVVTSTTVTLVQGLLAPMVITVMSLVEIVSPEKQRAGGRLSRRLQATR